MNLEEQIKELESLILKVAGWSVVDPKETQTSKDTCDPLSSKVRPLKSFHVFIEDMLHEFYGDNFVIHQNGDLQIFRCSKKGITAAYFKIWDGFSIEDIEHE